MTPCHRGAAWSPSAQRPHPAGDGPPDLVRRIFLNEMDPRHRLLGQRWPPADEVDQPIIGEDRTWLSLQEQLGHTALPQPVRIGGCDRRHVRGLALDGNLPRPRQRRPPPFARLGERPSILRHFLVGELTYNGVWRIFSIKKLSRRTISSPASERSASKAAPIPILSQWSRPCGATIASINAIPFTASRWRLAQSKPRAEPQSWMTKVTRSCTSRASSRASR